MLHSKNVRQITTKAKDALTVAAWALVVWKSLSLVTNTESPIVVVLSGSMKPSFDRGDVLFLSSPRNEPIEINDICVFKLPERPIPIVHRVIKIHKDAETQKEYILTKGDNNPTDDRSLYSNGEMWIHREHIIGKVKGFVPVVGMMTIIMNHYSWIQYALIGILGLLILL